MNQQHTTNDFKEAEKMASICEQFLRLTREQHLPLVAAARALGEPPSLFSGASSALGRYLRGGVAALRPQRRRVGTASDLTREIEALGWFVPAARFFYLLSNQSEGRGSVPEAIRRAISLPHLPNGWKTATRNQFLKAIAQEEAPVCPPEIRERILARERAGQPIIPERIAGQITINPAVVRYHRNPTNAALQFANASGGSKFTRVNGDYTPLRAGRRMQPDDGSINFCVCVPWQFPTTTTSRKWGVLVGRFQLLIMVDALTQKIAARSFVVRPRESYRTEDALHLYNVFMRQHGVPDEIWHEGHVWNSGRVKDCLDLLNVRRHLVHSPHNKAAVETRFNKLWTVLSVLSGGQIGRYRGEMEKENDLLRSCRGGHTDPRRVFPMLQDALEAIDQAIAEANATPVNTDVGLWVPDELWAEHMEATPLRKLETESAWMFWPCCEERTMRNGIKVSYPLFEEYSAPFTFAAPWMHEYEGARVRVYFDPWGEGRSSGMVTLAQAWNGRKADEQLGLATQTNDVASYARLMLGIGYGPDDSGRRIRQEQIAAMRSSRKGIIPGGRGITIDEQRDGVQIATKIERAPAGTARLPETPAPEVDRSNRIREVEQFERDNQHLFL